MLRMAESKLGLLQLRTVLPSRKVQSDIIVLVRVTCPLDLAQCVSRLLLDNKLPHIYSLQVVEVRNLGPLTLGSCYAAINMSAGAVVLSDGSPGAGQSASKLTQVVVGKISFLTGGY